MLFRLLLPLLLLLCIHVHAQEPCPENRYTYFNGDLPAYLRQRIVYPKKLRKERIEGTVYVKFTIDTMGRVVNPYIKKGLHPDLDSNALEVVRSMPAWEPAVKDCEKIETPVVLPIKFSIED